MSVKYIEIGGGYAIGADDLNIILYQLIPIKEGKLAGGTRAKVLGYFSNTESLVKRIANDAVLSGLVNVTDIEKLSLFLSEFTDKMYASVLEVVTDLRVKGNEQKVEADSS